MDSKLINQTNQIVSKAKKQTSKKLIQEANLNKSLYIKKIASYLLTKKIKIDNKFLHKMSAIELIEFFDLIHKVLYSEKRSKYCKKLSNFIKCYY